MRSFILLTPWAYSSTTLATWIGRFRKIVLLVLQVILEGRFRSQKPPDLASELAEQNAMKLVEPWYSACRRWTASAKPRRDSFVMDERYLLDSHCAAIRWRCKKWSFVSARLGRLGLWLQSLDLSFELQQLWAPSCKTSVRGPHLWSTSAPLSPHTALKTHWARILCACLAIPSLLPANFSSYIDFSFLLLSFRHNPWPGIQLQWSSQLWLKICTISPITSMAYDFPQPP